MSATTRRAAAASLLALALAGCGSAAHPAATTTTTATTTVPATTTTTAPAVTTTTLPKALQPSAADAAALFIGGWERADRSASARVASGAAVDSLFAHPYAGQTVITRGCSDRFPPFVCSYGPNGGGSGALYELYVARSAAGWYVQSVRVEG